MSALVELLRDAEPEWRNKTFQAKAAPLTRSLPFFQSSRGEYVHRVRSGRLYTFFDGRPSHTALSLWCGQSGSLKHGELKSDPGKSPVCGTCEGRAVGAGQPSSITIVKHPTKFSPRLAHNQLPELTDDEIEGIKNRLSGYRSGFRADALRLIEHLERQVRTSGGRGR